MSRTVSNTLCALLVLTSYLWGGCVNCEDLFMKQDAMPDCCQHGKCDRSSHESSGKHDPAPDASESCETVVWGQAQQQDSRTLPSAVAVHVAADSPAILDLIPAVFHDSGMHPALNRAGDSPPDLPVLHSSLLI